MSIRLRKQLANAQKNTIKVKILLFLDFLHNVFRVWNMIKQMYSYYDTN